MTSPRILVCGEAWGSEEAYIGHPLVGPSGKEFIIQLREAGILPPGRNPWTYDRPAYVRDFWLSQDIVALTSVFNFKPENNNVDTLCCPSAGPRIIGVPPLRTGKYLRNEFESELERLAGEVHRLRPNLVILLGGTAAWAFLGKSGITSVRGSIAWSDFPERYPEEERSGIGNGNQPIQVGIGGLHRDSDRGGLVHNSSGQHVPSYGAEPLQGVKILPIYHPAAVLRDHSLRHVTILDLKKAAREAAFPDIRRPQREVWIEPTIADLHTFYNQYLAAAPEISIDIETQGRLITCIGFAPSPDRAIVVPFRDQRQHDWNYWRTPGEEVAAWKWVRKVCCNTPARKVFQNGMYDAHFLWKEAGIPVPVHEDTMLLHHSLQPESPKGLGFLGSCYTNEASWKLLNMTKGTTYKKDN